MQRRAHGRQYLIVNNLYSVECSSGRIGETPESGARGMLDLASLVTHRYRLEQIAEAIETTRSGTAGRVVLDLGPTDR